MMPGTTQIFATRITHTFGVSGVCGWRCVHAFNSRLAADWYEVWPRGSRGPFAKTGLAALNAATGMWGSTSLHAPFHRGTVTIYLPVYYSLLICLDDSRAPSFLVFSLGAKLKLDFKKVALVTWGNKCLFLWFTSACGLVGEINKDSLTFGFSISSWKS